MAVRLDYAPKRFQPDPYPGFWTFALWSVLTALWVVLAVLVLTTS